MASIAIITARGGSKRIPRKNIKDFCGKPIIAYSIEVALECGMFDEVMVSTDDSEIAEIAKRYGASVPFMRSAETANDYATTADVLIEVLNTYERVGKKFDFLCCIYPTAPFITVEKLKKAMNLLKETRCSTVVPIVPFSFPPQRGFVLNMGTVSYKQPENALVRSQDLEKMYHDCGQFYCVKVVDFLSKKRLVMDNTQAVIMNEMEVQDIDNYEDWELAELKYKIRMEREG